MKKTLLILALLGFIGLVSACSSESHEPPKSPCVGTKGSPCDWRKPTNNV